LKNYTIEVVFEDNSKGIVDFLPMLNKSPLNMAKLLKNKAEFAKVKLTDGVLNWLNGQFDIAPYHVENYLVA
jgi:hypothetical protein